MAISQAEKQRRYRQRHLGIDGTKDRLQCLVSISAKAILKRLAHFDHTTVASIIESLAVNAEDDLLNRLDSSHSRAYLDRRLQRNQLTPADFEPIREPDPDDIAYFAELERRQPSS